MANCLFILALEEVGVDLYPLLGVAWESFFWQNGVDGAGCFAGSAVDAFGWVDEEVVYLLECGFFGGGMDTVDGADIDAGGVFTANAGLCNNEGHGVSFYCY